MTARIEERLVGRPRHHPLSLHLAYGALCRVFRSGARTDIELENPYMWQLVLDAFNEGAAMVGAAGLRMSTPRITWQHFRHGRELLTASENLELLRAAFTAQSLRIARELRLLEARGPGSLTHPHRSRVVYGDGTVVRPLYRPAKTGGSMGRQDLDAATFVRHDGPIHGNNFVALSARGPDPYQRVVLAVDRVTSPGREADCAVELFKQLHAQAGGGIQALVYDGAMHGVHIEELMTSCGVLVINKVAYAATPEEDKQAGLRNLKSIPLGVFRHQPPKRPDCAHVLATSAGAVVEVDHDETGELVVLHTLRRVQVKRVARPGGGWRFTLGVEIPCPHETHTVWLSPHPQPGDDFRRPENLRLLPEADPDFGELYGMRNDSESLNNQYKRTLLIDRAAALGGRRQLLDVVCFGVLHNALTWQRASNAHRALQIVGSAG